MAADGHQHRRRCAVFSFMGELAVPELVERRAAGGLLEQCLGLLVAEPGAAALVQIVRGELDPGLAAGDEQRTRRGPAGQAGPAPPWRRTRALRWGRSRSSMSIASASSARAAVS